MSLRNRERNGTLGKIELFHGQALPELENRIRESATSLKTVKKKNITWTE
jgi:hypothetical protein